MARTPRDPDAPKRTYVRKPGISIPLSEEQRKGLREMARATGTKFSDFLTSLFSPIVDAKLAEFESNRDLIAARARAVAAKAAAERAAALAAEAEAELAKYEVA